MTEVPLPITSSAQHLDFRQSLSKSNRHRNEKVFNYLVAHALSSVRDQTELLELFVPGSFPTPERLPIWYEAEPISCREREGNTKVDLALGAICRRGETANGIAFDRTGVGWVCLVEAKLFSDCSTGVQHDQFRNQIARVIETAATFQTEGEFPERVAFTLLTPRGFRDSAPARLYSSKYREYSSEDREALIEDVKRSSLPPRNGYQGWVYPTASIESRLKRISLKWAAYEDVFEIAYGWPPFSLLELGSDRAAAARIDEQLERVACLG